MTDEILIVALPIETQNKTVDYITTIYTGVGKVNAGIKATQAILELKPNRVINYGTAGSHIYNQGELIDCTSFVQRDMNIVSLGFGPYETPFEKNVPVKLSFTPSENKIGKNATCYSGDSFVEDKSVHFEIVDMEAYAIAKACFFNNIEFISYKYVTDGADENSGNDWEENCKKGIDRFINLMWEK